MTADSMRPLLIGEDNPYGAEPYFALYPKPEHASGGRLCHLVLGFRFAKQYLDAFDRVNLCSGRWSLEQARAAALAIILELDAYPRPGVVLLGAKVCKAFGQDFQPFTRPEGTPFFILPHPSGRNRAWNVPGAFERARDLVAPLLVERAA